jgi:iron(III) transport system permease protein
MSAPPVLAPVPPPAAPPAPGRRHQVRAGARGRRAPAWLLLPALVVAAGMLLPLAYLLVRGAGAGERALEILTEPQTLQVLANTALLAALVTTASAAIALPLAWLTTRTDLPGRRVWAVLAALPLVVPTYVGGFAYVTAFGPRGMLQSLLAPLGVERLPEIYGLPGATLALTLFSYPYLLLTVRAALLGMDPSLEDASRGLGTRPLGTFLRVTLPQLRPAIGAGALLVALYALSDFGAVSLLRFSSFTRVIYVQYQGAFDRTPAAVLALLLVALTITLLVAEARTRGRVRLHRSSAGSARQPQTVALGRWRWPALAFCALVVGLALVVPLGVLGYWLARGVAVGEPLRPVWTAALNSLRVAGIAALVAAVAALPIAVLSVRHRSRATALLERTTYLGYALPGIVVALSLVFFGARYAGPLYQTLTMLVLAYLVLFLPQAVGAIRASVLQVPPSVEEAARGLGRSGPGVLLSVTAPLVRPGVLAGMALVFLTAMKELPATLLLGPTGYPTLATAVWSATSEAFFARAAGAGLLLVALSGVPLAVLLARRGSTRILA